MAKLPWWVKSSETKKDQDGYLICKITLTRFGKIYLLTKLLFVDLIFDTIKKIKRKSHEPKSTIH